MTIRLARRYAALQMTSLVVVVVVFESTKYSIPLEAVIGMSRCVKQSVKSIRRIYIQVIEIPFRSAYWT